MSTSSEGPDQEPVADPVAQTGRPPVPRPVPEDGAAAQVPDGGRHRTEQVPFPLPPLPQVTPESRPAPVAGPQTGQLDLGDYPPRVPGGLGRRSGTAAEHTGQDDDGARDDR